MTNREKERTYQGNLEEQLRRTIRSLEREIESISTGVSYLRALAEQEENRRLDLIEELSQFMGALEEAKKHRAAESRKEESNEINS